MSIERMRGGTSLIDVLDRVLDKGIVIDAWVRLSLAGIDLVTIEGRVVVASISTYLKYSDRLSHTETVATPPIESSGKSGKFGNAASSRSALRSDDEDQ